MEQGYKLTAITMEEEARTAVYNPDPDVPQVDGQDLSDWAQVGLKTEQPPSLVAFYRKFYSVNDQVKTRS